MIERLLPAAVTSAEAFEHRPDHVLFPAEQELVARAVEARRREFASVRHCARTALAALGLPPVAVLRGDRGEPRWPAGIVGSMTHCAGYCAAVTARAQDLRGVGVDAEPDAPLPQGVLTTVALPDEIDQLTDLAARRPDVAWDRLLFCAKEATYKAWYPLTGSWLGFEEALVSVNPDDGTFAARLLVPGPVVAGRPLTRFEGRWLADAGLLLTAVAVPG